MKTFPHENGFSIEMIQSYYALCIIFVHKFVILVATVTELEGMIQGQKQLMEKLTVECKTLTNRLEDATLKHK